MKKKALTIFPALLLSFAFAHGEALDKPTSDSFLAGQTRLSNSIFNIAYTGFADAKKYISEGNWSDLVGHVLSRKFEADLYYFMLGRAAEGMGAKSAANVYYRLALSASTKCSSYLFGDGCMGYKFPAAVSERLEIMSSASPGKITRWGIGAGPKLTEISQAKLLQVSELSIGNSNETASKGKFETDAEFTARGGSAAIEKLLVFKLPTSDESRCKTSYDHVGGVYRINQCKVLSGQVPVLKKTEVGESFSLANMVDKRDIKRNLFKTYFLDVDFYWTAEYQIGREVASAIDDDLFVAVQFGKFGITSECGECDSRRGKEATANLISSLGALQGKTIDTSDVDWKKEAFRTGSIEESWEYRVTPADVKKIVVFRKSDSRVLFETRFE